MIPQVKKEVTQTPITQVKNEFTLIERPNMEVITKVTNHPDLNEETSKQLKIYENSVRKEGGILEVTYHKKEYSGIPIGRYYPTRYGGTMMWGRVRTNLFGDSEYDVDIVNCAPTIASGLLSNCKVMKFPILDRYVNERDAVINEFFISEDALRKYNDLNHTVLNKKDVVKSLFNILLNGGTLKTWMEKYGLSDESFESGTNCIDDIVLEFMNIRRYVVANEHFKDKVEAIQNERKSKGERVSNASTASILLHDLESQIVDTAIEMSRKAGFDVTTRIHDGYQVRIKDGTKDDATQESLNNHLTEVNEAIKKKMKFDVKFINKRFREGLDLSISPYIPDNTFYKVAEKFEQNVCKIVNRSLFVVRNENGFTIMNKTNLKDSYEDLVYMYQPPSLNGCWAPGFFIQKWLRTNPDQKKYDDMGVYPNDKKCPKNHFNLWTPFQFETVKVWKHCPEELKDILHLIKVLCGNDETVYQYFIRWIGQMIVHPELKTVMPVFLSAEGVGKGTLIQLFRRMLGKRKVVETSNPERDVWGDFNGLMVDSFLVNLNEMDKCGEKHMGRIKTLIVDDTLHINKKGKDQFEIASYHRFIGTSNNLESATRVVEGQRRQVVIRCSDELKGNSAFFTKIRKHLESDDVIATCYNFFKGLDGLDSFHREPKLVTAYEKELIEAHLSPLQRWLISFVSEIDMNDEDVVDGVYKPYTKDLLSDYNSRVTSARFRLGNAQKFSLKLNHLPLHGLSVGTARTKHGRQIEMDIRVLKKELNITELEEGT